MIAGSVAAELSDGEAALRVYLAAGGLVLLGGLLLALTIRWWRGTRPEPPSLAPLEVMGERKWAKAPDADKQRLLEQYRPATADGTTPIIAPEPVDLAALARVPPRAFDDLIDDGSRFGDEARVVGPLVVGGVVVPPETDDADADMVESDAAEPDLAEPDVAESDVAESDDVDETVAIESDADEPVDATAALIAPHDLDDIDDADDFARDPDAVDTGESLVAVEPDEAVEVEGPSDDTRDVVQQALALDDDLVDHTSAGD
jgi:hypothetical protein